MIRGFGMRRSSNPVMGKLEKINQVSYAASGEVMTFQGVINKSFILFGLLFIAALSTWNSTFAGGNPQPFMMVGMIGGLIFALVTVFKPTAASYTAPLYAVSQGLLLGGLSAIFEMVYKGIVIQAVGATLGVFFVMLFLYKTEIIKVTDKLIMGIVSATGAIFIFYFVSFILSLFGARGMVSSIYSGGIFGIGFSVIVVAVAAFNLLIDFEFIKRAADGGAPRYVEWYSSFAILVTLIWLYMEILRLLAKLKGRD